MGCTTVTRRLEFDAGHRVMGHEGKCATCHGHRYVIEVTAESCGLDKVGRVIDFSVLKRVLGSWLDENWDHTMILNADDVETVAALRSVPRAKEPYVARWNPTAENMADFLLRTVCPDLLCGTGVRATRVRVFETPNCYAEASL